MRPVGVAGLDERLDWAGSAPGTVPLTQASLETSSENDLVGYEKRQVIQTAELGPKAGSSWSCGGSAVREAQVGAAWPCQAGWARKDRSCFPTLTADCDGSGKSGGKPEG